MHPLKPLTLVFCVIGLAHSQQLGDVVEGNTNLGTGNTILSAGNFVNGDGNIVAPMGSDIFANNPFFSSDDLFDPLTQPATPSTNTLPIYGGPIPPSNGNTQSDTST